MVRIEGHKHSARGARGQIPGQDPREIGARYFCTCVNLHPQPMSSNIKPSCNADSSMNHETPGSRILTYTSPVNHHDPAPQSYPRQAVIAQYKSNNCKKIERRKKYHGQRDRRQENIASLEQHTFQHSRHMLQRHDSTWPTCISHLVLYKTNI